MHVEAGGHHSVLSLAAVHLIFVETGILTILSAHSVPILLDWLTRSPQDPPVPSSPGLEYKQDCHTSYLMNVGF